MRPSRGRGRKFEAEPSQGSWVVEAKPRRDSLKNCLEAASSRDSCLEDYIPAYMTMLCLLAVKSNFHLFLRRLFQREVILPLHDCFAVIF